MGEGGSSENPILLDEEEDKENSPPTTPASECPTDPPRFLRSRPLEEGLEMRRKLFIELCLNNFKVCVCLILVTFS